MSAIEELRIERELSPTLAEVELSGKTPKLSIIVLD